VNALEPRLVRFMRSRGLVRPGERVLVALSGGVDSMVLLHLLRSASQTLSIEITAAHFDHGMRADSEADAEWLIATCKAMGVRLVAARSQRVLRGETEARFERYRFLTHAARETDSARIATAHHADDQIETVLFRLLRGTGTRGLAGIPVRRGPFIRPLLRFSKNEIRSYATANRISFREDPTNEQLHYMRNRIRNTVIPVLESVQPRVRSGILALARHSARTENAWTSVLAALERDVVIARENRSTQLARPVLLEYHPELRARVLRMELRRFGVVPGRAQTTQVLEFCSRADSGAALVVAPKVRIERAFDEIRLVRVTDADAVNANLAITSVSGEAQLSVGGRSFVVEWCIEKKRADAEVFDPLLLETGLELRSWRAGDRIRLPYGTKKLKKLFAEHRVAASERARIPVLTDSHGRVLWVVGVARSIDALPANPDRVLNITVQNAESL
jgi:tRNA(Ile)-lysidine synthase